MRHYRAVSCPFLSCPSRLTACRWIVADGRAAMCRGLYVPDDDRWPEHFRGLGIRIEDSVCVREENPLVLTTEAVKEVGARGTGLLNPRGLGADGDGGARLLILRL